MADRKAKYRVAIVGTPDLYTPNFVRTVLDYGEHRAQWRCIGPGTTPFVSLDDLENAPIDGLIGRIDNMEMARQATRTGAQVVTVSAARAGLPVAYVGEDNESIGRLGGEYLLGRGFRQLAFFSNMADWHAKTRLDAFQQVIADAGRQCHVRLYTDEGPDAAKVVDLIPDWLDELPKPVAVMGHQDAIARLTVNAAVAMGLRVPDDVAVLGVGNNPWASILAAMPISTIELNQDRIAQVAAETLDALLDGGAPPPPRWVPPVGVITRRSTDITLVQDQLVTDVLAYIRDHCGEGLTVDRVMDRLEVSRRHLEKRMKRAVGITPQIAIFRAQIERAKSMLAESHTPIEAISRACGFRQPARLNQVFKRLTGMTPGDYRRQYSR
jgi:LacI family transcriptional regulator